MSFTLTELTPQLLIAMTSSIIPIGGMLIQFPYLCTCLFISMSTMYCLPKVSTCREHLRGVRTLPCISTSWTVNLLQSPPQGVFTETTHFLLELAIIKKLVIVHYCLIHIIRSLMAPHRRPWASRPRRTARTLAGAWCFHSKHSMDCPWRTPWCPPRSYGAFIFPRSLVMTSEINTNLSIFSWSIKE